MRKLKLAAAAIILLIALVGAEILIIRGASNYEPETSVLFAKVKIPGNALITADMLEARKIGRTFTHRLSLKKPAEAVGKIAKMEIEQGEMLLSGKLVRDLPEEITVKDRNKRLFAVEFKGDQANGWWVPADRKVDILFVPNDGASTGSSGLSRLENIRVAALIDDRGRIVKEMNKDTVPRYISFEVTKEQADFLAAAKSRGRLELSVIPKE